MYAYIKPEIEFENYSLSWMIWWHDLQQIICDNIDWCKVNSNLNIFIIL